MTGAELLVGGWFTSPVINAVLGKAQKYLGANYELHKNTREMIETLTSKLILYEATVLEVENTTIINNPALEVWLRRLKLVVYDAEDVLDDIEAKSIKEKGKGKNMVSEFASTSLSRVKNMLFTDDDLKSLKKVVDNLIKLSEEVPNFQKLVIMNKNNRSKGKEIISQRETISQSSVASSTFIGSFMARIKKIFYRGNLHAEQCSTAVKKAGLYGREPELNLIFEMIFDRKPESTSTQKKEKKQKKNTTNGHLVICIDGMGGIGKTALAQAVINNPQVQQTFETTAWVYVSCNFDFLLLMRKIFESLGGFLAEGVTFTLEYASKSLSSIISEKRFLIVLDDMYKFSSESDWEMLYNSLSHGAPGSVVLITTRSQEFPNWVANRVESFGRLTLSPLHPENFWELFESFAFANLEIPEGSKRSLEQTAKLIAEKLDGLPLAAKVIGSLLNSNLDEDEWTNVLNSNWWDSTEIRNEILPSIGLNYEHLEPKLRQCFAYCSLFPKNSVIDKDRLIQMWMAQNFLPCNDKKFRPEEVGRKWFEQLVNMFFFQPTWDNKGYVMPNFMHDLAIYVSSDECFYLSDESRQIPPGIRHIAVDTKKLEKVKEIETCKHLRTFLFFGFCVNEMYETIDETLSKLQSLRVLDLSYLNMGKEPPPSIHSSSHIRFLDLSYTGIEVLTHSNSSFNNYHLQSLHIQGCKLSMWPTNINKLINLRHLKAGADTIARISGIGQLTSLQELNEYRVGIEKGHKVTELKNLREITGSLLIKNCEKIKSENEAMEANVDEKKHLESIELSWNSVLRLSNVDTEILKGLKLGDGIKELTIVNYLGSSFPDSWVRNDNFPKLQKLHLLSCKYIRTLPLNRIAPSISSLSIEHNVSLDEVPLECLSASLRTLKINDCPLRLLHIYSLTCLTSLEITNVEMEIFLRMQNLRSLENLVLDNCQGLCTIEDLHLLTYLKRLKVIGCRLKVIGCCNLIVMDSIHGASIKQKGKGLEMHQGEGLRSLSQLVMDGNLWRFYRILGRLPSLRVLTLMSSARGYIEKFSDDEEYSDDEELWFRGLSTLRELNFVGPYPYIRHLPDTLVTLSSLQEMKLQGCLDIESLPENGMPPNLLKLTLNNCYPGLVRRCRPFVGEDWQLISHIPLIQLGHEAHNIAIRKFTSDEGELWKLKEDSGEWQIIEERNAERIWYRAMEDWDWDWQWRWRWRQRP